MSKPWYEELFSLLAGKLTDIKLDELGAGNSPSATVSMPISATGYTSPTPPSTPESRDLAHCHPELRRRYELLKADFERETGRQLFETCTWRSSSKQQDLYRVGRRGVPGEKILTKIDGVEKRSRHNFYPAQAVDVCVDSDPGPGKHAVWDPAAYEPIGHLCARHGLRWGGDFSFKDYPHIELPPEAV
jgi:hypothetical protein